MTLQKEYPRAMIYKSKELQIEARKESEAGRHARALELMRKSRSVYGAAMRAMDKKEPNPK